MGNCDSFNIKNQLAEEKVKLNTIIEFSSKAKKAICEIKMSIGRLGCGFFCKIPYTDNNNLLLPVLITCNHILDRDSISFQNIDIILNGEPKTIPLEQRKKWTNEDLDFTCIEIKEKEDNINTFYYLDDKVLDNNCSYNYYENMKVLIFSINNTDKQIGFSNGLIKKCESHSFTYFYDTYQIRSGGCIVNQANNCVIGIHQGGMKDADLNVGIFIREIIRYIKDNKVILSKEEILSNVNK